MPGGHFLAHANDEGESRSSSQSAPNVNKKKRDFSKAPISERPEKAASVAVKLRSAIANAQRFRFLSPRQTFAHGDAL
jgi:hypothetical protein